MNKNMFALIAALFAAAFVGASACSKPSAPPPLNCEPGTHQEGDKCVPNQPIPVSTNTVTAPAAK